MVRALDALGVEQVLFMPEPNGIGAQVARALAGDLVSTRVEVVALDRPQGNFLDSIRSAEMMREAGCALIVVMGGDGTCRVVSKGCGEVPILPVSSGTNNVFPQFVEGTLLGLAAGALARGFAVPETCCEAMPMLELLAAGGDTVDVALVDLAVIDAEDIGSRAVWRPESILELFLTRASPARIGLSSIGGWLHPREAGDGKGLYLKLGATGDVVAAPIAPGLIGEVHVVSHRQLADGDSLPISHVSGVIALDGEREVVLAGEHMHVRYRRSGPRVVNLERTLEEAARGGMMRNHPRG